MKIPHLVFLLSLSVVAARADSIRLPQVALEDGKICALSDAPTAQSKDFPLLKCWDTNGKPFTLPPLKHPTSFSISAAYGCAIDDGRARCWTFDPRYGQTEKVAAEINAGKKSLVAFCSPHHAFSCVIDDQGTVYAQYFVLRSGYYGTYQPVTYRSVKDVAFGEGGFCVIQSDGKISCQPLFDDFHAPVEDRHGFTDRRIRECQSKKRWVPDFHGLKPRRLVYAGGERIGVEGGSYVDYGRVADCGYEVCALMEDDHLQCWRSHQPLHEVPKLFVSPQALGVSLTSVCVLNGTGEVRCDNWQGEWNRTIPLVRPLPNALAFDGLCEMNESLIRCGQYDLQSHVWHDFELEHGLPIGLFQPRELASSLQRIGPTLTGEKRKVLETADELLKELPNDTELEHFLFLALEPILTGTESDYVQQVVAPRYRASRTARDAKEKRHRLQDFPRRYPYSTAALRLTHAALQGVAPDTARQWASLLGKALIDPDSPATRDALAHAVRQIVGALQQQRESPRVRPLRETASALLEFLSG